MEQTDYELNYNLYQVEFVYDLFMYCISYLLLQLSCTCMLIASLAEYLLHSYVKYKFLAQQNLVFQNNVMINIHGFFQWNLGIKLKFVHV